MRLRSPLKKLKKKRREREREKSLQDFQALNFFALYFNLFLFAYNLHSYKNIYQKNKKTKVEK